MRQVSRLLLETILRVNNVSSKDETRLHLNGVHIFNRDEMIIVESCDGYKAVRETINKGDIDLNESVILHRDDIKKLKKFLKDHKTVKMFECELLDRSLVIKCGQDIISIFRVNREYVRLDSVIPKSINNEVSITFNPKYLLEIFEALKLNKNDKAVTIKFNSEQPLTPIMVSIGSNGSQVAVLMP